MIPITRGHVLRLAWFGPAFLLGVWGLFVGLFGSAGPAIGLAFCGVVYFLAFGGLSLLFEPALYRWMNHGDEHPAVIKRRRELAGEHEHASAD